MSYKEALGESQSFWGKPEKAASSKLTGAERESNKQDCKPGELLEN